jgi:iron complex outermembrane receptor protein
MVIATTGDLMERMEAEEALEKSLATSEQALRELPDPKFALDQHAVVGVTDVHGTITYVNEKFRAISQHSGDELIGQNHPQEFFQQMYHSILAVPSRPPPARRRAKFHSVLRSLTLFLFTALALAATAVAQQDLTQLSLEDLMDTKVTSVSRKEQSLSRTASAISVITSEDIRRSGATNIPDLLRMVPGVDVAQIDANTWAITVRGLNGRFSNEVLVMLDGRNVYTPTFGGAFWDVLDLPLEDIERVEVIRGPGATIWGANAVNGVINIITKKPSETRGGMVVAGAGNLDQGFGTVQYGGSLGKSTDYRVYTKYFNQDHLPGLTGQDGGDGWHLLRGGFRSDSRLSTKDKLMVQGDLYTGTEGQPSTFLPSVTSPGVQNIDSRVPLSGGFLYSVWDHVFSARSDTSLKISFDRYERDDELLEQRRTFDVEFQHHIAWGSRQDFVWGANYRNTDSHTHGDLEFSLNPANVNMQLFGLFVQDEIALVPDKLFLTAGIKLDHNYYTGFNILPSAGVVWTPNKRHMFWAAIAQANRTPAETDTGSRITFASFPGPGGVPALAGLVGNPHFDDEVLTAYQTGYRTTVLEHLSIDLAAYYGHYYKQQTTEPAAPFSETTPAPPHLVLPVTYENLMHGEAHGLEMAVDWKATDRWTLSPGYGFEQIHMHLDPTSRDTGSVLDAEGNTPVDGAQLRSHLDLTHGVAWDASTYFVDRLRSGQIPSYTRLDTGLTWRWTEGLAMSLVGQNLVKDRHLEFVDDSGSVRSTLIKRSAYAKFTWQF